MLLMMLFSMLLGEQTPLGFAVQGIILGQPFLWMWLHENGWAFRENFKFTFYLLAEAFILAIFVTGFQIGYYRTHLIIQYAILTVIASYLYNQRNSIKEAICLGFLTVFLNSYYWEIPLHIAEFLSGPPHIGMLVQFWRLIPIPFFLARYKFTGKSRLFLSLGLGFSWVIMCLRFILTLKLNYILLYALNRFICLLLLVKVIMEAEKKSILSSP